MTTDKQIRANRNNAKKSTGPPPIDGGARGPGGFSKMHGKSRTREGAGPQAHACGSVLQRASSHRRGGCTKRGRKSLVAHTLSVPRPRLISTPGSAPTTNDQTNPISPNPCEINGL